MEVFCSFVFVNPFNDDHCHTLRLQLGKTVVDEVAAGDKAVIDPVVVHVRHFYLLCPDRDQSC